MIYNVNILSALIVESIFLRYILSDNDGDDDDDELAACRCNVDYKDQNKTKPAGSWDDNKTVRRTSSGFMKSSLRHLTSLELLDPITN